MCDNQAGYNIIHLSLVVPYTQLKLRERGKDFSQIFLFLLLSLFFFLFLPKEENNLIIVGLSEFERVDPLICLHLKMWARKKNYILSIYLQHIYSNVHQACCMLLDIFFVLVFPRFSCKLPLKKILPLFTNSRKGMIGDWCGNVCVSVSVRLCAR